MFSCLGGSRALPRARAAPMANMKMSACSSTRSQPRAKKMLRDIRADSQSNHKLNELERVTNKLREDVNKLLRVGGKRS
jgi:hypothetical protein